MFSQIYSNEPLINTVYKKIYTLQMTSEKSLKLKNTYVNINKTKCIDGKIFMYGE